MLRVKRMLKIFQVCATKEITTQVEDYSDLESNVFSLTIQVD